MADLAAAGAARCAGLAHRVRREVVVMDITLLLLLEDGVELLCIAQSTQGAEGQDLGLTAGEHAGTVYARQNVNLGSQRTDFLHAAAVDALAVCQPASRCCLDKAGTFEV